MYLSLRRMLPNICEYLNRPDSPICLEAVNELMPDESVFDKSFEAVEEKWQKDVEEEVLELTDEARSFIDAISMPSVPVLLTGSAKELFDKMKAQGVEDSSCLIEARYTEVALRTKCLPECRSPSQQELERAGCYNLESYEQALKEAGNIPIQYKSLAIDARLLGLQFKIVQHHIMQGHPLTFLALNQIVQEHNDIVQSFDGINYHEAVIVPTDDAREEKIYIILSERSSG